MKGYKVFHDDWTCKGFQFEVGKIFEEDVKPKNCKRGFHFCINLIDCFKYYEFDPKNKVAEIEALGEIDTNEEDWNSKCCTNKIHIIREISWYEVLESLNKGFGNTGHSNIGNSNTGKSNTGDNNTGNSNKGHYNTGYNNTGNYNTGKDNIGSHNSGEENRGCYNTGNYNTHDSNSGNGNHGFRNTGDYNEGNYNSGDNNIGDRNTGDNNCGSYNTGDNNYGTSNSGDYNVGDYNAGCFNTGISCISMFNQPSNWTLIDWRRSKARTLLRGMPTNGRQGQEWWNGLTDREREIIMALPNFNKAIFKKITGIEIEDKTKIEREKIDERL